MKTIRTAEATGPALDWLVAKAQGVERDESGVPIWFDTDGLDAPRVTYSPTTNWAQGGPIIERAHIALNYCPDMCDDEEQPWVAEDYDGVVCSETCWGATPLIAAMKCYVALNLGDEAEVPEELL